MESDFCVANNLKATAAAAAAACGRHLKSSNKEGSSDNNDKCMMKENMAMRSSIALHPMLLEDEEMLWELPEEWRDNSRGRNYCTSDNKNEAVTAVTATPVAVLGAASALPAAFSAAAAKIFTSAAAATPAAAIAAAVIYTAAAGVGRSKRRSTTPWHLAGYERVGCWLTEEEKEWEGEGEREGEGVAVGGMMQWTAMNPVFEEKEGKASVCEMTKKEREEFLARRPSQPWYLAPFEHVGCWLTENLDEEIEKEREGERKGEGEEGACTKRRSTTPWHLAPFEHVGCWLTEDLEEKIEKEEEAVRGGGSESGKRRSTTEWHLFPFEHVGCWLWEEEEQWDVEADREAVSFWQSLQAAYEAYSDSLQWVKKQREGEERERREKERRLEERKEEQRRKEQERELERSKVDERERKEREEKEKREAQAAARYSGSKLRRPNVMASDKPCKATGGQKKKTVAPAASTGILAGWKTTSNVAGAVVAATNYAASKTRNTAATTITRNAAPASKALRSGVKARKA